MDLTTEGENFREIAADLDGKDPLAKYRDQFYIPTAPNGGDAVYLTGNSLGLQPKTTADHIQQELDDWKKLGVEGHVRAKTPWLPYHEFLTEQMARLVGADPIETVVMNSLTVNLHLMMVSFYRPEGSRTKIIIEKGAFPSDQYAVASQLKFHGLDPAENLVELSPRVGEATLRTSDIVDTIDRAGTSLALVMLGGVNYYTGQAFDMKAITDAGHRVGATVGFDLAHAAGNLELRLHDWDVDFAVWCSYKYLNAGPGAVAGTFVNARHAADEGLNRFAGWWGHDKATRFKMGPEFRPIPGAEGWQISNPPIFQMAALRASLEIFDSAGMPALRQKSVELTGFLATLVTKIGDDRISIITPEDPRDRGCQLSIRVPDSDRALFEVITQQGIFADWREPDVIRVAPVPLYNTFADAVKFTEVLRAALDQVN